MIRAISIDFWNTIGSPNPKYSERRTDYLSALFDTAREEADAIYKRCKHALDAHSMAFGSAVTPLTAIRSMLKDDAIDRSTKINPVIVLRVLNNFAAQYPPIVTEEVKDALRLAASKMPIVVTSNTNFIGGKIIRMQLEPRSFGGFTFSDELGVSKPDPDIFNTTVQGLLKLELSLTRDRIVHIGDHEVCDVLGAQRAGLRAIQVTDPADTARLLRKIHQLDGEF